MPEKSKKLIIRIIILVWIFFIFQFDMSARQTQQIDPFYRNLMAKAEKAFLFKNYAEAARDFEIATFGLNQDTTLQAKASFYIGLCHFYLKDVKKSASFLRQGADLLGDRSLAVLGIPDSVLPDLDKLLTFFDIQLALPTQSVNSPPLQEQEKQKKASESPPETGQKSQQPAEKEPARDDQKDPGSAPPITLDKIKEGDIIALDMVDTLPVATRRIAAVYPSSTSGLKITGTVTVNALISEKGNVIKTEIIQGIKGAVGFDQAAAQAVRRWKFEPAAIKGIKVKVWMPISIVFKKQE
jgi:TonB family protein